MVGWAIIWALDPTSREHDMTAAVRAATFDAMLSQIVEEAKATDISDEVRGAAAERARAIVGEALGRVKRSALPAPGYSYNADVESEPELAASSPPNANGTRARARREAAPKG